MPYDQFTIEQLAGDLVLPNPSTDQLKSATAFHRNTMNNEMKGGTDMRELGLLPLN